MNGWVVVVMEMEMIRQDPQSNSRNLCGGLPSGAGEKRNTGMIYISCYTRIAHRETHRNLSGRRSPSFPVKSMAVAGQRAPTPPPKYRNSKTLTRTRLGSAFFPAWVGKTLSGSPALTGWSVSIRCDRTQSHD